MDDWRRKMIEAILEHNRQLNGRDQEAVLKASLLRIGDLDLANLLYNLGISDSGSGIENGLEVVR